MLGAGTLLDVVGESCDARYVSSSAAALINSCGMTVVHSAFCLSSSVSRVLLDASLQNDANCAMWLG